MRLVLWDLDGTLVHAARHGRDAFAEAYEAVFGGSADIAVPFAGHTDHQIALAILERNGVEGAASHLPRMWEALADAMAGRQERIREEGRALPGAREALEALAERDDAVQSVLTGNIEANAAVKLGAFDMEDLVDLEVGAYGSDPHSARSDLVAIARNRAARKYGVEMDVADTVLVGDTPLDVRAAREAGARAVAVSGGFSDVDALRESEPDALLEDLRDLDAVVEALGLS